MNPDHYKNKKNQQHKIFMICFAISLVLHFFILYKADQKKQVMPKLATIKSDKILINYTLSSSQQKEKKKMKTVNKVKANNFLDKSGYVSKKQISKKKSFKKQDNTREKPQVTKSMHLSNLKLKRSYKSSLLKRINRFKYYPLSAQRFKETGLVRLKFIITRDGQIKGAIKLLNGTKYSRLNNAGITTVKRASPFPPFPSEISTVEEVFIVDIVYRL